MTTHDFRINGMPTTGCKTLERDSHAQFLVRHSIVTTMRIPPCLALRETNSVGRQLKRGASNSNGSLHLNCGKQPRHLYSGGFQKDLHLGKRGGGPLQEKVVDLCLTCLLLLRTVRSWPEHLTAATRYCFKILNPRNRNEGCAVLFSFQLLH